MRETVAGSFVPRRRNYAEAHPARDRRMWVTQLVAAAITAAVLAATIGICLALQHSG